MGIGDWGLGKKCSYYNKNNTKNNVGKSVYLSAKNQSNNNKKKSKNKTNEIKYKF